MLVELHENISFIVVDECAQLYLRSQKVFSTKVPEKRLAGTLFHATKKTTFFMEIAKTNFTGCWANSTVFSVHKDKCENSFL